MLNIRYDFVQEGNTIQCIQGGEHIGRVTHSFLNDFYKRLPSDRFTIRTFGVCKEKINWIIAEISSSMSNNVKIEDRKITNKHKGVFCHELIVEKG